MTLARSQSKGPPTVNRLEVTPQVRGNHVPGHFGWVAALIDRQNVKRKRTLNLLRLTFWRSMRAATQPVQVHLKVAVLEPEKLSPDGESLRSFPPMGITM
jgi:hypothetical protein